MILSDEVANEALEEIEFCFKEIEYFIDKFKGLHEMWELSHLAEYYLKDIRGISIQIIKNTRSLLYEPKEAAKNGN